MDVENPRWITITRYPAIRVKARLIDNNNSIVVYSICISFVRNQLI